MILFALYTLCGIGAMSWVVYDEGHLKLKEAPLAIIGVFFWPILAIPVCDELYKKYEKKHGEIFLWKKDK